MTSTMKTYSLLIAWNDNDREEGEYGATVRATDVDQAEVRVRKMMADDDMFDDEDRKMARDYGRVIDCHEGAIWKAAQMEQALRDIVQSADANDGGSLANAVEASRAIIVEIDSM